MSPLFRQYSTFDAYLKIIKYCTGCDFNKLNCKGFELQNYFMTSDNVKISLFQGVFENNILTVNTCWDKNANMIENFTDVRDIQKHLKNNTISFNSEADKNSKVPTCFVVSYPDGNTILADQHI